MNGLMARDLAHTKTWNGTGLSIRETSFDRYLEEYILGTPG
jgi:hypothetical protein